MGEWIQGPDGENSLKNGHWGDEDLKKRIILKLVSENKVEGKETDAIASG
jgi:hypothetical protein